MPQSSIADAFNGTRRMKKLGEKSTRNNIPIETRRSCSQI